MTNQTLEQQRDQLLTEVSSTFRQSSTDRLALALRAENLCVEYEKEGGQQTQRWFLADHDVARGTYYDLRDAGRAQNLGVKPAADRPDRAYTDLVEAGRMINRKTGDGLPLAEAVAVAQEAVFLDTVGVRNRNAKRDREGLDELDIPDVLAPLMREQARRIAALARKNGHVDAPSTAPEQLGFLAQAVAAIGDDVWVAFLREML